MAVRAACLPMHLIVEIFIEIFIHAICGWIGHWFVRGLSFNKIQLDLEDNAEEMIAITVGIVVTIAAACLAICVSRT